MSEWTSVRLAEVAAVTVGHVGPMIDEYRDSGIPFLRSLNVRPHAIEMEDLRYIDEAFHGTLRKSALAPGDVVTVRTGKPGQTAMIPLSLPVANCSDLIITRPGPGLHGRWLSYYLNWVTATHIDSHLVGAVQQHFNIGSARSLVLDLPPLDEQRAIAEVLGALDDKIAANARLAEVADELVRARFKSLGDLSDELTTIGTIAIHPRDLIDPTTVSPDVPYVGLEHVPRRHMWMTAKGTAGEISSTKALFRAGDVLFGKLRPYFHKVVVASEPGMASTDILVVRATEPGLRGFLLAAASSDLTVERCTAASEGTRMPRTKWKDLAAVQIPWPGEESAREFGAYVDAMSARVASAVLESARLAETRDALLPGLMSRNIHVKDTERVIEEVV
ncbi:restriction endonuclease subunit S [Ornithinimicrobium cryptoxanthini]|uniref:Restriction endonuclease subunit S n=1 Tax=Ornithinimicrobium cryptoxanthini TaxID=2934161 RepID=A0ABY4YFW1_9MICO|nr:restriction endonuclease subunit S [Ornithinimicrobium cryptoxanthini]USQ75656.1 restriction endonuclease subunit S [Ornithinimicrobium cryptoxanthini]